MHHPLDREASRRERGRSGPTNNTRTQSHARHPFRRLDGMGRRGSTGSGRPRSPAVRVWGSITVAIPVDAVDEEGGTIMYHGTIPVRRTSTNEIVLSAQTARGMRELGSPGPQLYERTRTRARATAIHKRARRRTWGTLHRARAYAQTTTRQRVRKLLLTNPTVLKPGNGSWLGSDELTRREHTHHHPQVLNYEHEASHVHMRSD